MIIFKDWLKEKGALEEYEKHFSPSFDSRFNIDDSENYLEYAFDWDQTESGAHYWYKLHNEWGELLDTIDYAVNFSNDCVPETPVIKDDKETSKPIQYQIGIDTFDRMKANASFEEIIGGCKLNIDKYIWRKKGSDREDWEKARDYIELGLWAFDNKIEKDK